MCIVQSSKWKTIKDRVITKRLGRLHLIYIYIYACIGEWPFVKFSIGKTISCLFQMTFRCCCCFSRYSHNHGELIVDTKLFTHLTQLAHIKRMEENERSKERKGVILIRQCWWCLSLINANECITCTTGMTRSWDISLSLSCLAIKCGAGHFRLQPGNGF